MENKINVAELLKDCPTGMELDCTMIDNVVFEKLDVRSSHHPIIIRRTDSKDSNTTIHLTKYGQYSDEEDYKCVIFPKGKTTWEGFHKPFEDGDIVAFDAHHLQIFIFKDKKENNTLSNCYLMLEGDELDLEDGMYYVTRFATEEEKAKLFKAIKDNGYKWDPETKTLEKLEQTWTIQYAKDGDVLAFDDETIVIFKDLYNNTSFHSYCHIEDGIFTISKEDMPDWWRAKGFYPATEEQCTLLFRKIKEAGYHWNAETKTLEKLPKFKVGDKIIKKNGLHVPFVITGVSDVYYWSNTENSVEVLLVADQDDWELVPDKFAITTLKPFDKVLVRHNKDNKWCGSFFSHIDKDLHSNCYKFVTIAGKSYPMMIPYEGNERLRGTTNDCDEYFKTW